MGLVVRSIGLAHTTTRITLADLTYTMRRLVWIEGRGAPRDGSWCREEQEVAAQAT